MQQQQQHHSPSNITPTAGLKTERQAVAQFQVCWPSWGVHVVRQALPFTYAGESPHPLVLFAPL